MMQKTKCFKIAIIIFAFLMLFLSFIPIQVNADEFTCPTCGNGTKHNLSWYQKADFDFTNTVYSGNLFAESDGDASGFSVNTVLAFDITTGLFKDLWTEAERLYGVILPVGELLAFIYYLMTLMEKSLSDKFSAEQLARDTIRLVGMLLILRSGFELLTWGMNLSAFVYQKLQSLTSLEDNPGNCKAGECGSRDFFGALGHMLSMLIPYLLISIARLVVRVICWNRVLGIIVRVIFAPIGMADSVKGGTSSQGFRYFKKIVAIAMQGTLILGVSVAYNLIVSAISADGSIGWVQPIVLAAVVITLIFKTSSMADEMLGV